MESKKPYLDIEEQLLKESFVSPEEMAMAREVRDTHLSRSQKPIGLILLDQGQILEKQLQHLLSLPETQARIGEIAVERQLITQDHLIECNALVRGHGPSLSRILVDKGYLSDTIRKKLIYEQLETIDLAKQAIKHHMILEKDLEAALKLKTYQKSTCEILFEQNLITLSELNHAFRKFSRDLKLGQILFQQALISEANLNVALGAQAADNQSLGKILLEKKWVAIEQLYFALSIQYNTPFQKLDGYVYYEKQKVALRDLVGQRYANENLILPLFQSGSNLTLGVSNPANIWSMHGLKSMYPELQMTCVLIFDEKFEQLYALLYGEMLNMRSGRQPETSELLTADATVVIRNPLEEQALIKSLYQIYHTHKHQDENVPFAHDEQGWFYEFIEDSYRSICEKYDCSRVQYRCDVKDERTEILASPVV
jgi:type II secretion system (T2SS) protein E